MRNLAVTGLRRKLRDAGQLVGVKKKKCRNQQRPDRREGRAGEGGAGELGLVSKLLRLKKTTRLTRKQRPAKDLGFFFPSYSLSTLPCGCRERAWEKVNGGERMGSSNKINT